MSDSELGRVGAVHHNQVGGRVDALHHQIQVGQHVGRALREVGQGVILTVQTELEYSVGMQNKPTRR